MGTFKEYCNQQDEGVGQFVKGIFNAQYRALSPHLKKMYDFMTPAARQEIEKIRTGLQIPLADALRKYIAERGLRDQWQAYQDSVGTERKAYGVKPSEYEFGQWSANQPGWKRYGA